MSENDESSRKVEDWLQSLGPSLRALRTRAKRSQSDVAERSGMPSSEISRYERGRAMPDFRSILRFLVAVDANLLDLAVLVCAGTDSDEEFDLSDIGLREFVRELTQTMVKEELDRRGYVILEEHEDGDMKVSN